MTGSQLCFLIGMIWQSHCTFNSESSVFRIRLKLLNYSADLQFGSAPCLSVCLSVCLLVLRRDNTFCILFSPSDSTETMVFKPTVIISVLTGSPRSNKWDWGIGKIVKSAILKRLKIRPLLLWNAKRKPYPISFRMVPFLCLSASLPLFQGYDIIQSQLTGNWYKIKLCLQWQTNSKSYMIYRTAPRSWGTYNPVFKVKPLFDTVYLRWYKTNVSCYGILIETYTRPNQGCHFEWSWVTMSD